MEDPFMQVRAALSTTTHATGGLAAVGGGAEIQKKIDQMIADTINRGVDLRPLVTRKPMGQLAYFWNLRVSLNDSATSKAAFYSDGGTAATIQPSEKTQLYATALALRSDYEVTGLMQAGSSSYYDALGDEAQCALDELKLAEEKAMICGDVTGAYGLTSAYNGLQKLMRWTRTNGGDTAGSSSEYMDDTTTIFGLARSTTTYPELDCSYVIGGTIASATGVLELKHLDKAITLSNKHGGKDHDRVFFCSEERVDEINRLLQPQQRFAGTLNLEGGFTISTYKGIPIVGSRYMDKNGVTNTGSFDKDTDGDNSMYLLDLDMIEFRVLNGVDAQHVAVSGEKTGTASQYNRADVVGGYYKTYGIFVMRAFHTQVNIFNLTAP